MTEISLSTFYNSAIENKLSIAIWSYPKTQEKYAIIDFDDKANCKKVNFEEDLKGFVFSSFLGDKNFFINADFLLKITDQNIYETQINKISNKKLENKEKFFKSLNTSKNKKNNWYVSSNGLNFFDKTNYCNLVDKAVNYIKKENVHKIVTSRSFQTLLKDNFDCITLFENLCTTYQNAFISLVSIPNVGTWIGATPELLLSIKNNQLKTVALAGTQKNFDTKDLSKVTWSKKDIEEQKFVSDYIKECFEKLEINNFQESETKTIQAGNILHLQTVFDLDLNNLFYQKEFCSKFLNILHPTPAICGTPKEKALSFITSNEGYNREFYSGFLGIINIENQSNLFVNLRCMQLKEKSAILYVGGGITKDSTSENEWQETEYKADTLLSVINKK